MAIKRVSHTLGIKRSSPQRSTSCWYCSGLQKNHTHDAYVCDVCVDHFRALLNSAQWRRARIAFLSAHPFCSCGEPATDVDHIDPWRKNPNAFWDSGNFQALCHSCHAIKTAQEYK
jgi:5-methylcytosine-specific restriction endonuclease McrA